MLTTDLQSGLSALDTPPGVYPDPDDLIKAAMEWHFGPDTGSRFWLERAKTLDFDPRRDVGPSPTCGCSPTSSTSCGTSRWRT